MAKKKATGSIPSGESLQKIYTLATDGSVVEATPQQTGKVIGDGASEVGEPTTAVTFPTVAGYDANGNPIKTSLANFFKQEEVLNKYENVEPVMIYLKSPGSSGLLLTRIVTIDEWISAKYGTNPDVNLGGVMLLDGGTPLLVAPTGSSAGMNWSKATGLAGTAISSFGAALLNTSMADGEASHAAINASGAYSADKNDTSVAVGFVNKYATDGLAAGKWRLPACGELVRMRANMRRINEAIKAVGGTEIPAQAHWSNTESSSANAWLVYFTSYGHVSSNGKASNTYYVRPVSSAF